MIIFTAIQTDYGTPVYFVLLALTMVDTATKPTSLGMNFPASEPFAPTYAREPSFPSIPPTQLLLSVQICSFSSTAVSSSLEPAFRQKQSSPPAYPTTPNNAP